MQDTIFALSTPPGKSGVAIIRISGEEVLNIWRSFTSSQSAPTARVATLKQIFAADGQLIDRALILYFQAPHSVTGEDVLELHLHGGRAIIQAVINRLTTMQNTRPAEPGEFMRRAFLSSKHDLLEIEAIADMIDAETSIQLHQATNQMQGRHSEFYQRLREHTVEILALLEAYIDFPEEDIPESVLQEVLEKKDNIVKSIDTTLNDGSAGERIRAGFRVAIIGKPNVGKSALLNALAGRDAAIVSSTAGTTRDVIEVAMDLGGYAVTMSDTAGIREAKDDVEKLGIERSIQQIAQADIVCILVEVGSAHACENLFDEVMNQAPEYCKFIGVLSKSDLYDLATLEKYMAEMASKYPMIEWVKLSAKEKDTAHFEQALKSTIDHVVPAEDVWITQARHRQLLVQAKEYLNCSVDMPLECLCEEIRLAANSIGKITGSITTDELLGIIFSRFCIGK